MIDLFSKLQIPDSCYLGKPVFKKLFYENTKLNATDKKAFVNDIEKIEWIQTLKPETINIPEYEDEKHEYLEIAIIQVLLKENSRYKRIARIIQKAIPYPVVIVFKYDVSFALNLASKRINRADQNKIKVEDFFNTDWINLENPSSNEIKFLENINIRSFSYNNFYEWYSDFIKRVVALNCAGLTNNFTLDKKDNKTDRVQELQQIYSSQQELAKLESSLKKETQFNRKMDLSMKIKKIKTKIKNHKKNI